jgi:MFS family permease
MLHHVESNGIQSKRGVNVYNILTLFFISLGSMSYGYSAAVIGTTLGQPSFYAYFDLNTRSNGTDLISSMNGLFQAGGVIGSLLIPYFSDKWGRKWAIAVGSIFTIVSGAILAGSTNPIEFIVFRFFSGAGAFMMLTSVPVRILT